MTPPNSWRWELDPRDPDYEDPPDATGEDFDEPPKEAVYDYDGPKHYIPPREP